MHIDKRASRLAAEFEALPGDVMIDTREAARLLGVSVSFLEEARSDGSGPRFMRFGRAIRYACRDLRLWLQERAATCTSENGRAGARIMAGAKQQIARRRIGGV